MAYNWQTYPQVLCTNLIHARQFMKSQVYDSPLWCTMTCFGACLYSGGTHYTGINRIWQRPVWPIWFRWPTQEPVLATHNPRKKSRERLKKRKKKKKEWTGSDIGLKKADIPFVEKHGTDFNGKTFNLSGFLTEETSISASAVPHCYSRTKE